MPINIPDSLPAAFALRDENIFYLTSSQAEIQDIRELRILILNLMPKKIETELHLLRMLSNSPLQIHIELLRIDDSPSKNTPMSHMETFYKDFDAIKDSHFDGMIITGAPLGQVPFSEVKFWEPLCRILDWTETHVTSTMFLCWAVQAAMFHLYGKEKEILSEKLSGVYPHQLLKPLSPIVRGFDHEFQAPHSRYAEVPIKAIESIPELEILAVSRQAGAYLFAHKSGKHLFVTGHSEYEPDSLKNEYLRDVEAGANPKIPQNYFRNDNPTEDPVVTWRSHGSLLFSNWLNYFVYQLTPFDLSDVGRIRLDPPIELV